MNGAHGNAPPESRTSFTLTFRNKTVPAELSMKSVVLKKLKILKVGKYREQIP